MRKITGLAFLPGWWIRSRPLTLISTFVSIIPVPTAALVKSIVSLFSTPAPKVIKLLPLLWLSSSSILSVSEAILLWRFSPLSLSFSLSFLSFQEIFFLFLLLSQNTTLFWAINNCILLFFFFFPPEVSLIKLSCEELVWSASRYSTSCQLFVKNHISSSTRENRKRLNVQNRCAALAKAVLLSEWCWWRWCLCEESLRLFDLSKLWSYNEPRDRVESEGQRERKRLPFIL